MKKADILLGLQWGDEGKGKMVDVLTPKYDIIARFQGGPNAGHTLEFEGQKYVLRSIPSGIFQGGKVNLIGNGVVLDPVLFQKEAEELDKSVIGIAHKELFEVFVAKYLSDLVHYFCFSSWYSFSVLTFQIADLSVLPLLIAFTASKEVTIEWSILLYLC